MFSASAEFYDLIYSTFKDYAGEAAQIASLLRRLNPHCQSVLDVACGTGEHARLLAAHGFVVDGVDLDPAFVHIAKQKHPPGRFFEADMSDFHLSHRYDAVLWPPLQGPQNEHVERPLKKLQAPVVARLGHSRRKSTALDVGDLQLVQLVRSSEL